MSDENATARIGVMLTPSVAAAARVLAAREGRTLSTFVRRLVEAEVDAGELRERNRYVRADATAVPSEPGESPY